MGFTKHSMAPLTLDELEIYHCLFGTRTEQNLPVRGPWPGQREQEGGNSCFQGLLALCPKMPSGQHGKQTRSCLSLMFLWVCPGLRPVNGQSLGTLHISSYLLCHSGNIWHWGHCPRNHRSACPSAGQCTGCHGPCAQLLRPRLGTPCEEEGWAPGCLF